MSASSIASLVPEPIEKCAVCAASPSRTTLSCTQCSLRTVVKLIQRELFAITSCPSSTSANSSRIWSIDFWSDSPGAHDAVGVARRSPAASHTAEVISTMNVLPVASNG